MGLLVNSFLIALFSQIKGFLKSQEYDKILAFIEQKKITKTTDFFLEYLYNNQFCSSIYKLINSNKKEKLRKNQILFKQNDKINDVFIIKKGEILVSKKINLPQLKQTNSTLNPKTTKILQIAKLYKGEILGADCLECNTNDNTQRDYFAECVSIKATIYRIS
eukprot:TRINITY_DN11812_c0_g1_i2.p2 TRINITY_DN11812_c0_g1~~TRINITY_DN11812_c0_g1_i2.p2  ORF type:complete len:163 (-),score=30.41 TRINITY_DN11812_c0_g1_i2:175-663(-)